METRGSLIMLSVVLGVPLTTPSGLEFSKPLWSALVATAALPTTSDRYTFFKHSIISGHGSIKSLRVPDLFTCQTCGTYSTVYTDKKRSDRQRAFKTCSYCEQVCRLCLVIPRADHHGRRCIAGRSVSSEIGKNSVIDICVQG